MAIIVFQHGDSDGLGRIAPVLRDHGHLLDVRRVDLPAGFGNKGMPTDFDGVSGVISLGGAMNVGDGLAWMDKEMAYLREAHARQLPLLGVCLGAQMIAAALGGEVGAAAVPEFGFGPVGITVPGQTETMLAGIPWTSRQWQCHGQEVKKLPEGGVALASSPACKVQAFKVGLRTYGFQYHFESERSDIDTFLADGFCQGLMQKLNLSAGDVRRQSDEHYEAFARVGVRLCENFAQYMFPPVRRLKTA